MITENLKKSIRVKAFRPLVLNKINKNNTITLPGFCYPFGLFHSSWGVLRYLSQLSITAFHRQRQGWTEWFRKPCTIRPFSWQNSNPLLVSHPPPPPNAKGDSPFAPISIGLEKFSCFLLQFELFSLHYWSFQLSAAPCDCFFDYSTSGHIPLLTHA